MVQPGTTEGLKTVLRALSIVLVVDSLVLYLTAWGIEYRAACSPGMGPGRKERLVEKMEEVKSICAATALTGAVEFAVSFALREEGAGETL